MESPNNSSSDTTTNSSEISSAAIGLWSKVKVFIIELLDFRGDTDRERVPLKRSSKIFPSKELQLGF